MAADDGRRQPGDLSLFAAGPPFVACPLHFVTLDFYPTAGCTCTSWTLVKARRC